MHAYIHTYIHVYIHIKLYRLCTAPICSTKLFYKPVPEG